MCAQHAVLPLFVVVHPVGHCAQLVVFPGIALKRPRGHHEHATLASISRGVRKDPAGHVSANKTDVFHAERVVTPKGKDYFKTGAIAGWIRL